MERLPESELILLADDTPENLQVLAAVLAAEVPQLAFATDGMMVLELLKNELPELILMDVMMPRLDGFETLRRLKADPATRDIPVLLMTSLTEPGQRLKGLQLGAVDYITKPYEEAELVARVRTQLALCRMTRTLRQQNAHLSEEVRARAAAEAGREALTQQLLRRTEELHQANAKLAAELMLREQAEAARAQLQQTIVMAQRDRLIELSTPLIPITERIMVMPLIGTLDGERAQRVLEVTLQGARDGRAEFLILDLTGLREVESSVVTLLLNVSAALRLLGTRAILTGIRADIAGLGAWREVPSAALITRATLQDGIAYAMAAEQVRGLSAPVKSRS